MSRSGWWIIIGIILLVTALLVIVFHRPLAIALSYRRQTGDVLFQSLPLNPMVAMIEGATGSSYSHCGILVEEDGHWFVVEALDPVRKTPFWSWVMRGRGQAIDVYRPVQLDAAQQARFITAAERHLGKPYDHRYRLDDETIYCSELVFKAYREATGNDLGTLEPLSSLNWRPYQKLIEKLENGPAPLDRLMITPAGLARSERLQPIYHSIE